MSHRMYVAVLSLGSASLGLLAASLTLHAVGCGPGADDLFSTPGTCVASVSGPSCACNSKADCPTTTECMEWTCDGTNHCKGNPTAGKLPDADQVPGDCKRVECTAGAWTTVNDDADPPTDPDVCMQTTCVNGEPHSAPRAAGADCDDGQNRLCDGAGKCVRCLDNPQEGCDLNEVCHKSTSGEPRCSAEHCFKNGKDSDETGENCGGSCEPCGLGQGCSMPSDCSNKICAPSGVCCESICNGICQRCAPDTGQCGDVPTGMTYGACIGDGKSCAEHKGCVIMSGWPCGEDDECMSGVCAGSPDKTCGKGQPGYPCVSANDCASSSCDAMTHICL